jgi:endoglucanase
MKWLTDVKFLKPSSMLLSLALAVGGCASTGPSTMPRGATSPQANAATGSVMHDLTSLQLARQMGVGWNLGNSLESAGGEAAWGNPPATRALFDAVKSAGFNTVRIPVSWKQHADADDHIDATWMARVTRVVDDARAAGLIVIVNIHWDGGWMQPTYARQATVNARLTTFWTQIATHFRNHDDGLLFAGTNEVMVAGDYKPPTAEYAAVQNSFNQTFVDAVRATGGNNAARVLVVQGFNTNIDYTVATARMPADPVPGRLMMEVHYYDPYDFTLNAASAIWQWGASADDAKATEPWADEAHVDAQFEKMKARFVDRGIPVILGEFAAISRTEIPGAEAYRIRWNRYVARSAITHGAVPVYWDPGSTANHSSGLFDRRTGAQVYPALIGALVDAER